MYPAGSTIYNDELPSLLAAHMKDGKSVRQFCRDMNFSPDAFYKWLKLHPELNDAFIRGRQEQQAWHEDLARNNYTNHKFNTNLFKFMTNVLFDWTEKKVVEQTNTHKLDEANIAELETAKKAHLKDV